MVYTKEIRRLIEQIPTDFPCIEGCVYCCNKHRWTWTEWKDVKDKRIALEKEAKCPYACDDGCQVYDQRPVICRLYGNCSEPISYFRKSDPFPVACPLGIEPKSPLTKREASRIFRDYMELIQWEDFDALNSGHCLLPAGPFGPFIRPDTGLILLGDDLDE